MQLEVAKKIAEVGQSLGFDMEARSYSGRGMMGTQTYAVTADRVQDVMRAACEAVRELTHEEEYTGDIIEAVGKYRADNLGHGVVIY